MKTSQASPLAAGAESHNRQLSGQTGLLYLNGRPAARI